MNKTTANLKPQSIASKHIINSDGEDFRQNYNCSPFMFSHNLEGHPLFKFPRLIELANTLSNKNGHRKPICHLSKMRIDHKLCGDGQDHKDPITETIANIEKSNSWVLLYSVQGDPEYAALLEQIITELEKQVGKPLRKEITWLDAYIFIASPHAATSYHIDHESTFLFQIQGDREANVFSPSDRQILSEEEIEDYFQGNLDAANYKAENQSKANIYSLTPGKGVHHPVLAPHCYKNGNYPSIALGVHFCSRSYDLQSRVYQVNYFLRKLGFKPTPPGQSVFRDYLKIFLIELFSKRNPASKFELMDSGLKRIRNFLSPIKHTVKWIRKR
jgi:hypothetical protein